jgi:hypothetical protein
MCRSMDSAFKALLIGYRVWGLLHLSKNFSEVIQQHFCSITPPHTARSIVRECNTMLYERELE